MKVWPKNDDIRKVLKHGDVAFAAEGPAEWPDDTFTHRRIMDGDVTAEDPAKKSAPQERGVQVDKVKTEKSPAPDIGKV